MEKVYIRKNAPLLYKVVDAEGPAEDVVRENSETPPGCL